eukprot:scaffold26615_cov17-Tisochrysis_lutea.AAC.3
MHYTSNPALATCKGHKISITAMASSKLNGKHEHHHRASIQGNAYLADEPADQDNHGDGKQCDLRVRDAQGEMTFLIAFGTMACSKAE